MSEEENKINTEIDRSRGQWFVVQVLSGHENKVRESMVKKLEQSDQIPVYEVFIPTNQVFDVRMGQKKVMTKKIVPGYLWIRMDLYDAEGRIDEKAWFFVRNVQGVLGFLGDGNRPEALSDAEVRSIITPATPPPRTSVVYKVGQRIRITDGPFVNSEGVVEVIDDERCHLTVQVQIFNRSTPVDLEFWQVESL